MTDLARATGALLRDAAREWKEDNGTLLGAALAYFSLFSLGPLLVVAVSIAGLAFGEEVARGALVGEIERVVGTTGAAVVRETLASASSPATGGVGAITGGALLLYGATKLFQQLRAALNTIWDVTPPAGAGLGGVVRGRLLSFAAVAGTGLLLLVFLAGSAALAAVADRLGGLLPGGALPWQLLNHAVAFAFIALLFGLLYRLLPDASVAWSDVWIGAVGTAFLFVVGQAGLALYLGRSAVGSAFGAAGSVVVVLVWLYYSALVFLFGAELTQVYANRYGSRVVARGARGAPPATA